MVNCFKSVGSQKCCICGHFKPAFKAFIDGEQCGYRNRIRKPVYWCKACWVETEKQIIADRKQRDEEIAAVIAARVKA